MHESQLQILDEVLDDPDFSITQYFMYSGLVQIGTDTELNTQWWKKFYWETAAQRALVSALPGNCKYICLDEADHNAELTGLIQQFFVVVEFLKKTDPDGSIKRKIGALKKNRTIVGVKKMEEMYSLKAGTVAYPGYMSMLLGVTPNKTAALFGVTLEELKSSKVLITGVGTGSFAQYSLPAETSKYGIDCSEQMLAIARSKNIKCIKGDLATENTWKRAAKHWGSFKFIVADYFWDIAYDLGEIIRLTCFYMETGSMLMVNILIPIDQQGADSKKNLAVDKTAEKLELKPEDSIGNTENPFADMNELQKQLAKHGLVLQTVTIGSYPQWDRGRDNDDLPFEHRPFASMVFEKVA